MLAQALGLPLEGLVAGSSAKNRRPWFACLLSAQFLAVLLRAALGADYLGAVALSVVVSFGLYALAKDMHITYICYWGLLAVLLASTDFVVLLQSASEVPGSFMGRSSSLEQLAPSYVRLFADLSLLAGLPLARSLYKDFCEARLQMELETKWAEAVQVEAIPFNALISRQRNS